MFRNRNLIVGIVTLVVITSLISFFAAFLVFNTWSNQNPGIYFNADSVSMENIQKYNQVRRILKDKYYQKVDENQMLEGAIAGMANSLNDPYTVYFTKDQMKMFMEKTEGSYVGIGISISPMDENGLITVVETFEGSPAQVVGMLPGDKIMQVDGEDITTLKDENLIIKKIKGVENTEVKINVYRPSQGKYVDFAMPRKRIKVTNISSKVLDGNIGYIRISTFDSEIAAYFDQHLNKLLKQGIKGLIIDVRDNPGGDYEQVVRIADRLLPKGLIVYTQDRDGNRDVENSDSQAVNLPLAVLVNGNSASASEILAGAVKDHQRGSLIGTKTFGKGLVQTIVPLEDGAGLKVTIARYYTPSGVCIQGVGIQPNMEIKLDEKYNNTSISQVPEKEDAQLQAALGTVEKAMASGQ